jgi:hypothetical protein
MRNEILTSEIGKPVNNKVLVEVEDTFSGFVSQGGIQLVNTVDGEAWGDNKGYNITEFIVRHGVVVGMPGVITSGSFDYETINELEIGDVVYWNSISFKSHQPIVCEGKKYLLVDYHEIILFIDKGIICPINGFVLLKAVPSEERALSYVVKKPITGKWEIYFKPLFHNTELNPKHEFTDIWSVGDIVHISVIDKPFKLEGDINKNIGIELYACYLRMVICSTNR